jgi:hypothetical protein
MQDGLQSLTQFLQTHGFELISAGPTGSGKSDGLMQEYSSASCNLIFFLADDTFYFGTNSFAIAESTKMGVVKKQEWCSLSYYIDGFWETFERSQESGMSVSDSLVHAFGNNLPDAIKLFVHVRRQGRMVPLRVDRIEALGKPNNSLQARRP